MAQVTMSGSEFAEFLKAERQLQELLDYFKEGCTIQMDEDSSYVHVKDAEMPQWLKNLKVNQVICNFLALSEEEFARWVKTGEHYYNPEADSFNTYSYSNERVDLLENKALKEQWDKVKAELQKEAKENAE